MLRQTQHLIYIAILFILESSVTIAMMTLSHNSYTTSDMLDSQCKQITCVKGDCYLVGTVPACSCDDMYTGPYCDVVNLSATQFIVIGSMVIFKWPRPPRLSDYSFIYYHLEDPMMIIYKRDIIIGDQESSALVGNLRDGVTQYRICIEKQVVADVAVLKQSMEYVHNCVMISTRPDYHTVFAFFIAGCSVITAVLLIYWQRDKIELLYFNRAITINNGSYNYNVAELIRLEKDKEERKKEYDLLMRVEEGQIAKFDKGTLNKMTMETIRDE